LAACSTTTVDASFQKHSFGPSLEEYLRPIEEFPALSERNTVEQMIGEGLREVGVLVLVFAILDKVIAGNITVWWTAIALAGGLLFFAGGCYIERKRRNG
jgi:hypothetical protein